MAWRFPRYPLLVTRTPDIDDLNRNFYEYVEEVGGRLNEHNWDESASNGLTISHMADDIFVWHSNSVTQALWANVDTWVAGATPTGGNWFEIPHDPQWRAVQGVSLSFTGAGGLLWIFASWQLRPHDERSGASPDTDNTPLPMFAIRVDGAIMTESMLGVVEAENYRNPGLGYGVWPQATSILVSVPPGEHTIDLVTRTAVKDVYPAWIGSRELICLEMRR